MKAALPVLLLALCQARSCSPVKLPEAMVSAHTVAVVAHAAQHGSGRNLETSDSAVEKELILETESDLRKSRELSLVEGASEADLILLLLQEGTDNEGGRSRGPYYGLVFGGGARDACNAPPLWVEKSYTMGYTGRKKGSTHWAFFPPSDSVGGDLVRTLKNRNKAATTPQGPVPETPKAAEPAAIAPAAPAEPPPPPAVKPPEAEAETKPSKVPEELLQAKTVAVIHYLPFREALPLNRMLEHALEKWGRFKIVENPEDADLLILMHHYHQYESSSDALLIFSGHHCAAGLPMPLWMSTAHEYTFQWHGSSFPFQGDLVLRLRQDIEQTEADRHSTASSLIRH